MSYEGPLGAFRQGTRGSGGDLSETGPSTDQEGARPSAGHLKMARPIASEITRAVSSAPTESYWTCATVRAEEGSQSRERSSAAAAESRASVRDASSRCRKDWQTVPGAARRWGGRSARCAHTRSGPDGPRGRLASSCPARWHDAHSPVRGRSHRAVDGRCACRVPWRAWRGSPRPEPTLPSRFASITIPRAVHR